MLTTSTTRHRAWMGDEDVAVNGASKAGPEGSPDDPGQLDRGLVAGGIAPTTGAPPRSSHGAVIRTSRGYPGLWRSGDDGRAAGSLATAGCGTTSRVRPRARVGGAETPEATCWAGTPWLVLRESRLLWNAPADDGRVDRRPGARVRAAAVPKELLFEPDARSCCRTSAWAGELV